MTIDPTGMDFLYIPSRFVIHPPHPILYICYTCLIAVVLST